ncbi:B12-binding domain-containing radical SAM protein [Actinoplanes sp. NPDC026623]|uniref:B12-binding domain-containing radical SAM protein n=1 Tax=Actinoplanes sp. NPDC026623 TaxID=3155610 RepID=UPI0033D817DB
MYTPLTLLVNPPLWNAYAPHLAVPLLAGTLNEQGLRVRCHDASIELLDWVLSGEGMARLAGRIGAGTDERLVAKARLVHPHVMANLDEAKAVIRDVAALQDPQRQAWARRVVRNAMWCVSAAFEGLNFDLVANDLYYSATSTAAVLAAIGDERRNLYRWGADRLLPADAMADPDLAVVGVSVSADTQLIAAMTLADRVRRERPDVKIVFGGNYVTRMVDRWTEPHPFFDHVDAFVLSEGEEALPELIRRFVAGTDPHGIPGVVTRGPDGLRSTPARPVRLDRAAGPDFDQMPLGRYFAPGPILPLYASRSCAWNCAFCSIPFASNSYRARPAAQTVDHMEAMMRRYRTRYFMFVDEIMTLRSLREVAQEIVDRGLDLYWYGETRFAGGITRELAELLYASGCRRLNFGLESRSQRVLNLMEKGTRVEHADRNLIEMIKAGISPHLFIIHGFPGETAEEAQETIAYAKRIVDEAAREHQNPYTTWGGSPFILDIHSPVGQHPERFGVELIEPDPEHDLALARDYTVRSGLSRAEAEAVARSGSGRTTIRRNVWFRTSTESVLAEVEEFTFLRAATRAPNAEPRRGALSRISYPPDAVLRLAATPLVLGWSADADGRLGALALYQGDTDRFIQLTWPHGRAPDVLSCATAAELTAFFDEHDVEWAGQRGAGVVSLLLRHGFLDGPGVAREPIATSAGWRFAAEPGMLLAGDGSRVVLHSPITGNTARLNALGHLVWLSCAEGESTAAGISAELPDPYRTGEQVAIALRDLGELGMVYPVAPAPGAATAPVPALTRHGDR